MDNYYDLIMMSDLPAGCGYDPLMVIYFALLFSMFREKEDDRDYLLGQCFCTSKALFCCMVLDFAITHLENVFSWYLT